MEIRKIGQTDRQRIDDFIIRHWYTLQMSVHGECIDLGKAEGFYALEQDEITGLVTYCISADEMEILSLDSVHENRGTGTALLNEAVKAAAEMGCSRIMLVTTNDNLTALRFYQKHGFDLVRVYRDAVSLSRKIKPEIPLIGENGIPLKHEIELEMIL